jgi:hypothetical protein
MVASWRRLRIFFPFGENQMQVTAKAVNWERLEALDYSEGPETTYFNNAEQVQIGGDPHWPSDSSIQFQEVRMIFEEICEDIREPTRSQIAEILGKLFGLGRPVLWDLQAHVPGGDGWFGAVSPDSVRQLSNCFAGIEYAELDRAFDARRATLAGEFAIVEYPSEDVFSGYFRQWEQLLHHATKNNAGIVMWVG